MFLGGGPLLDCPLFKWIVLRNKQHAIPCLCAIDFGYVGNKIAAPRFGGLIFIKQNDHIFCTKKVGEIFSDWPVFTCEGKSDIIFKSIMIDHSLLLRLSGSF